ncbi:Rieske (2Fe-2S) protein [Streptomyces mutabilis]|nr:Rieske (2Fe-2S) protein [Streptomyces mutabilis]
MLGAAALTAACGDGDDDGSSSAASSAPAQALVRTGDVPVGGGTVLRERKVVVTQPEEGDFRAFSAICTHQGCVVADVSGGTINCACHDSAFALTDGAVERGPATAPLPAERITVEGDAVRLA